MLTSLIVLFLLTAILFAGFASSSLAIAQQQTTEATTTTTPPVTTGQSTSPQPSPPLTPEEQEQQTRLQNVMAATTQNLDETEKQIGGVVYTPRWSEPVWVEPGASSIVLAYCLPGEFAESGHEILGGFELEVLESYPLALPQNFMAWMAVVGNEDRQDRLPAAVGVVCASDANDAETRVLSPEEQQEINNVVQQFTQVTSIDQVINIINNNVPTNGTTTTPTPPGSSNNTNITGGVTSLPPPTNTTGADITPPVVDIARGTEVQTPSGTILHFLVQASDNVDGSATLYTSNVLQQDDAIAGNIRISCNPTSGSIFSIGDTTIQCAAIDEAGNRGLASFTVSVTESGVSSSGTITTSLSSNPPMYNGSCPTTIEFSGTITDNGGNRDVRYRFIRSDGATGPEEVIRFDQPGSQTVSMTWDIGRSYQGWVAIEILQPTQLQSNRAEFELTCAPSTGALPGGADTTPPVLTVPQNIVVEDDRTIDFPDGNVAPYTVTARDDVDGAVELQEDGRTMIQDNVGGDITIFCLPASLSFFPYGENKVECTAIDQAGNRGTASFTVTVNSPPPIGLAEEQPPVEEAPVEEAPVEDTTTAEEGAAGGAGTEDGGGGEPPATTDEEGAASPAPANEG